MVIIKCRRVFRQLFSTFILATDRAAASTIIPAPDSATEVPSSLVSLQPEPRVAQLSETVGLGLSELELPGLGISLDREIAAHEKLLEPSAFRLVESHCRLGLDCKSGDVPAKRGDLLLGFGCDDDFPSDRLQGPLCRFQLPVCRLEFLPKGGTGAAFLSFPAEFFISLLCLEEPCTLSTFASFALAVTEPVRCVRTDDRVASNVVSIAQARDSPEICRDRQGVYTTMVQESRSSSRWSLHHCAIRTRSSQC